MAQDRDVNTNPTDSNRGINALWEAFERQRQLDEIRDMIAGLTLNANNRPPAVDRARAEGVAQGQPINQDKVRTAGIARGHLVQNNLRRPCQYQSDS